MRRLEEKGDACLGRQLVKPALSGGARRRREARGTRTGRLRSREADSSGRDGGRPGDGNDWELCVADSANQPGARVGDARRARVGDQRDVLACPKPGDQPWGLARLVVLAQADERLPDLVVREQLRRPSRVFGGDQIHLAQRPQRPERQVFQVADRRRDDEERCRPCVSGMECLYNGVLDDSTPCLSTNIDAQSCGQRFEQIRKFSDPPLEVCPKCGGPVEKLISSPGVSVSRARAGTSTDYAAKARIRRRTARTRHAKSTIRRRRPTSPDKSRQARQESKPTRTRRLGDQGRRRRDQDPPKRTLSGRATPDESLRYSRNGSARSGRSQREVHDGLQESQLVAGVVADAVDFAGVERARLAAAASGRSSAGSRRLPRSRAVSSSIVEDVGREDVAADDGEVGRRLVGGRLLDQVVMR